MCNKFIDDVKHFDLMKIEHWGVQRARVGGVEGVGDDITGTWRVFSRGESDLLARCFVGTGCCS